MARNTSFLKNAEIETDDARLLDLLAKALERVPKGVTPLYSVGKVRMRKRGSTKEVSRTDHLSQRRTGSTRNRERGEWWDSEDNLLQ